MRMKKANDFTYFVYGCKLYFVEKDYSCKPKRSVKL